MAIIECIPNISEGQRPEVVRQHRRRAASESRACACSTSSPTPRITARSSPWPATAARSKRPCCVSTRRRSARSICARTRASIRGSAPSTSARSSRSKASRWQECVALAREVGAEVAARFDLPVYLYEEAASTPARRNLEDIRRGEFEGLARKMQQPEWKPDFGPASAAPVRRRHRDRRAHAAHRLQHQPRHRSARCRQEDRRRAFA